MIDTVKLRSPYLSDEQARLVEQQLKLRLGVDLATGERFYEITSDALEGSFDNRVMVRLMREELVSERVERPQGSSARGSDKFIMSQHMRPCAPYLVVEGSVHKAMVGHNITGGPQHFQAAACWFVNFVAVDLLFVTLPHGSEWTVEKVDITECYRLPFAAIEEFIGSLNRVEYPRRERASFGMHSLNFGGTTTAFKLYHKGIEFAKHDGKNLRGREGFGPDVLSELQELANGIMRVEVSVKSKKLRVDTESGLLGVKGEKPLVVQVTDAYLQAVHDQEVARVIREGRGDVKTVRTAQEVRRRLIAEYGSALAGTLFGLWVSLSTDGEREVRKTMNRATFYRCRKQLVDAGCSWAGTDIVIRHSCIPADFSLSRSDARRDAEEDPRITRMLASYRQAA